MKPVKVGQLRMLPTYEAGMGGLYLILETSTQNNLPRRTAPTARVLLMESGSVEEWYYDSIIEDDIVSEGSSIEITGDSQRKGKSNHKGNT